MPTAIPIFIDEEHGSYTRTQFRRLRNAEKLELMEAWFRERYEDPQNETPWVEGEYIYPWGGPYEANWEIQNEFDQFVRYHLMEKLIKELDAECAEWAPTPRYRDDPRDEEDPDEEATVDRAELGSPEELAFRDEVRQRLDRLEAIIASRPKTRGRIGHNQPPEPLEDDDEDDAARIAALTEAVAGIRAELAKPVPDVTEVAAKRDAVEGIAARLRAAVTRKVDLATDELAKKLGQSAGGLPFWYGLYHAICDSTAAIGRWLASLGIWPF